MWSNKKKKKLENDCPSRNLQSIVTEKRKSNSILGWNGMTMHAGPTFCI